MSWFKSTPDSEALLAEERLVLAATEAVSDAMIIAGKNKQQLADLLNVKPSEISQRLSGRRNLTLRSLARMLHVLGWQAQLTIAPTKPSKLESSGGVLVSVEPKAFGLRPENVVGVTFKTAEFAPIFGAESRDDSSPDPVQGFLQSAVAAQ